MPPEPVPPPDPITSPEHDATTTADGDATAAPAAPDRSLHLPPFPVPWSAVGGATLLGTLVAVAVVGAPAGVQYPVAAVVLAAVGTAVAARRTRPVDRWSWVLGGLAVACATVPAVSDSTPMVVLSLVAAAGAGLVAVTGSRTWVRGLLSPVLLTMAAVLAVPWVGRRLRPPRGRRALPPGTLRGAVIGTAVLVLVGWLLVGADAAFASLLGLAVPDVALGAVPGRVAAGVLAAWVALAVALVVAAPPWEDQSPAVHRRGPPAEWAVPLAVAALLLAAFVVVQIVELMNPGVLLDGTETPAGRARQGFGQLVAVTVLLVALLAWAGHRAGDGRRARTVFACLGGTVVGPVVVVSATALGRMWRYQEEFGWTVLRILVAAFEVWLALLLLVVALLWLRRRVDLVPVVAAAAAAAGVLALGLARPEALAAEANVARFEVTGRLDTAYLATLSADAVPAARTAQRSPAGSRMTAMPVARAEVVPPDPWFAVNASRAVARAQVADQSC